jgi:hypothetical protein
MHRPVIAWWVAVAATGAFQAGAQPDPTPTIAAYCARLVQCQTDADASDAPTIEGCVADQPDAPKAAEVNDDVCRDLVDVLLRHYECQTTLSCEALLDPAQAGCAATGTPLLELLLIRGAGACFDGRPPVNAPPGWTCAPHYYNGGVGDGCDCGCGVVDRDCENLGVVGCGEGGCTAAGCDFCYLEGDNVSCDDDPQPRPGPVPPTLPPPTPEGSCAAQPSGAALGICIAGLVLARRRSRRAHHIKTSCLRSSAATLERAPARGILGNER